MLEAALWGLAAGSGLLIGAAAAALIELPRRLVALVMAFGSGALISALAFDLSAEAHARGGTPIFAAGIATGALVYLGGNRLIHRVGRSRARQPDEGTIGATAGPGIVLGVLLDGIPEAVIIGASLIGGGSIGISFLAAVFVSNIPEAIAGTRDLRDEGHQRRSILVLWSAVALASAAVAAIANTVMAGISNDPLGVVQAFAAGAILTMLADTMMPEAFDHGGDLVGLATVLGFAIAFLLSMVSPG